MVRSLKDRTAGEEGFTLIELMVVVLIIGILVAIALPTFLGARNRANDKAAQSSVRNALVAAKTIFTDTDDYSTTNSTSMTATEPSLTYVTSSDSTGPNEVSIAVTTTNTSSDTVDLSALSKADNCFGVEDISASGTQFFTATGVSGACAASSANGATATSW